MASIRRSQLIDAAIRLFQKNGYHATGIDMIVAEAGVSKMTLYKYFDSKEDLIVAALRCADRRTCERIVSEVARRAVAPRARLIAIFDVLDAWFEEDAFFGCLFINATAEYSCVDDPIHGVAAAHKRSLRAYLCGLAEDAGAVDPSALAAYLLLLVDGAIVTAQVSSARRTGAQAKSIAMLLIDRACAASPVVDEAVS